MVKQKRFMISLLDQSSHGICVVCFCSTSDLSYVVILEAFSVGSLFISSSHWSHWVLNHKYAYFMFCKMKRFENGCHFVSGDEEIIGLLKEISCIVCVDFWSVKKVKSLAALSTVPVQRKAQFWPVLSGNEHLPAAKGKKMVRSVKNQTKQNQTCAKSFAVSKWWMSVWLMIHPLCIEAYHGVPRCLKLLKILEFQCF